MAQVGCLVSSIEYDDKAGSSIAAVLLAAAVRVHVGRFIVLCVALVVTLVHRVFKTVTALRFRGGNTRRYEEAGKRMRSSQSLNDW